MALRLNFIHKYISLYPVHALRLNLLHKYIHITYPYRLYRLVSLRYTPRSKLVSIVTSSSTVYGSSDPDLNFLLPFPPSTNLKPKIVNFQYMDITYML